MAWHGIMGRLLGITAWIVLPFFASAAQAQVPLETAWSWFVESCGQGLLEPDRPALGDGWQPSGDASAAQWTDSTVVSEWTKVPATEPPDEITIRLKRLAFNDLDARECSLMVRTPPLTFEDAGAWLSPSLATPEDAGAWLRATITDMPDAHIVGGAKESPDGDPGSLTVDGLWYSISGLWPGSSATVIVNITPKITTVVGSLIVPR